MTEKIIGVLIKRKRKEKNINQQVLADKVGISRTSLCNIEVGRVDTSMKTLYKIAYALDVDIYDLLPSVKLTSKQAAEILI